MMHLEADVFQKFDRQWALVTAGTVERFNTMTIGWGGLGTLWSRPVATVYVRPNRYTYEFMEQSDYFTVSFFPPTCRPALSLLGTRSGRDGDKVAQAGLTPLALEQGVTFREAETTLLCRKLYWQDLDPARVPAEVLRQFYADEPLHRMYIGEVVEVIGG